MSSQQKHVFKAVGFRAEYCALGQMNPVLIPYFFMVHFNTIIPSMPVTVAERSEARSVFARSEVGVVGSNPTQSMDV
jgi:hypothetical protein